MPCSITIKANDWLYKKSGDGCSEPIQSQIAGVSAQCFKYSTGVGILKGKPKLNSQKSKTHIPDLPETQSWLGGVNIYGHNNERLCGSNSNVKVRLTFYQLIKIDSLLASSETNGNLEILYPSLVDIMGSKLLSGCKNR